MECHLAAEHVKDITLLIELGAAKDSFTALLVLSQLVVCVCKTEPTLCPVGLDLNALLSVLCCVLEIHLASVGCRAVGVQSVLGRMKINCLGVELDCLIVSLRLESSVTLLFYFFPAEFGHVCR